MADIAEAGYWEAVIGCGFWDGGCEILGSTYGEHVKNTSCFTDTKHIKTRPGQKDAASETRKPENQKTGTLLAVFAFSRFALFPPPRVFDC